MSTSTRGICYSSREGIALWTFSTPKGHADQLSVEPHQIHGAVLSVLDLNIFGGEIDVQSDNVKAAVSKNLLKTEEITPI